MALTADQITAQNFKDFYNHIMPYLNGQPALNYSTDEQVVGTWVDGSTLYQKMVTTGGSVPSGATLICRTVMTGYDAVLYTKTA